MIRTSVDLPLMHSEPWLRRGRRLSAVLRELFRVEQCALFISGPWRGLDQAA